jgi:hypothetical protein
MGERDWEGRGRECRVEGGLVWFCGYCVRVVLVAGNWALTDLFRLLQTVLKISTRSPSTDTRSHTTTSRCGYRILRRAAAEMRRGSGRRVARSIMAASFRNSGLRR